MRDDERPRLVEHEVPEHGLVRLLELQKEGLVVVEVQVEGGSPVAGKKAGGLGLPAGSRLVSMLRQRAHGARRAVDRRCGRATRCSRSCLRTRPRIYGERSSAPSEEDWDDRRQ